MLILNRLIYRKFYEKEKKIQNIIFVQMYEMNKIQMHLK
jgi:hypothetical protein